MSESQIGQSYRYLVEIVQNPPEHYKATLPLFPDLVGIGTSEEYAKRNLRKVLIKEIKHRLLNFQKTPVTARIEGVKHYIDLSYGAQLRISFVNTLVNQKVYLKDLSKRSKVSEEELRNLLSFDDADYDVDLAMTEMFCRMIELGLGYVH
jgi:hypothetical protein